MPLSRKYSPIAVPVNRVTEYEAQMLSWMRAEQADILRDIRDSRDFTDETKGKLKDALEAFAKQFA